MQFQLVMEKMVSQDVSGCFKSPPSGDEAKKWS